jgi:hypothetical protein
VLSKCQNQVVTYENRNAVKSHCTVYTALPKVKKGRLSKLEHETLRQMNVKKKQDAIVPVRHEIQCL